MDVDVESLTPRYRLVYDSIGRSLALPIARRLGLPPPILDTAAGVQPEHARVLNAALERLERTRAALDERLAEAAAQARTLTDNAAESTRLLGELRDRRRSAWQEEVREARAFLRQVKADGRAQLEGLRGVAEARAALDRFTREQEAAIASREQLEEVAPPPRPDAPAPGGRVQIGDTVAVGDRGIEGELLAVDGARAWIQRGTMRFEVPAAQLRRVAPGAAPRTSVALAPASEESGAGELNVIGLRAREALERLEPFLDRALRAGQETVRIVHGIGSGALRRAIQDHLATSPYCAGFRGGESNEGGAGVTVATLH